MEKEGNQETGSQGDKMIWDLEGSDQKTQETLEDKPGKRMRDKSPAQSVI